jgi:hypothetical protein
MVVSHIVLLTFKAGISDAEKEEVGTHFFVKGWLRIP